MKILWCALLVPLLRVSGASGAIVACLLYLYLLACGIVIRNPSCSPQATCPGNLVFNKLRFFASQSVCL